MKSLERDHAALVKITGYCAEIDKTVALFGNNYDAFKDNSVYKNAVSMCLLQIGELVSILSDDLKNQYSKVPWKQIRGLRNIVVHNYGNVDTVELWHTVSEDIPALLSSCENIIEKMDIK